MDFAFSVWRAAEGRRLWLMLTMLASSLSPVGMLAVLNEIIGDPNNYRQEPWLLVLFILLAVGVVVSYAVGTRLSVAVVEGMLADIRMQLIRQVRRLEYSAFEQIGQTRIYDTLTRNAAVISEAAMAILPGYAAVGSLLLGGLFTLFLSPLVFATLAVLIAASAFFISLAQRRTRGAMIAADRAETGFLHLFGQLLGGFKEVRLHGPRGNDLEGNYLYPGSQRLRGKRFESAIGISRGGAISYVFFYLMLGTIAFVLPPYVDDLDVIVQSLYVAVFLLSLVEIIIKSLPLVERAGFALDDLQRLAVELSSRAAEDATIESPPEPVGPKDEAPFQRIALANASFSYRDSSGTPIFSVGPIDLEFGRGEAAFIIGGNGSGKSTFLRMLCRLYPLDQGTLLRDGVPVTTERASAYRGLFSSVFTDFHLFDRLYGLPDRPETEVNGLLQTLGIGHKVRYDGGRFSTTELSTGQRKRLAFAVAILEQRPILILDELAADQDREFRERFYGELLPGLKREGRTLLVVSHDDPKVFTADRILRLRDGRLFESDTQPLPTRRD